MYEAIIFDAYGTLISTGTGSIDATSKMLEALNLTNINPRDFYSQWKAYHKRHINSLNNFVNEETIFNGI